MIENLLAVVAPPTTPKEIPTAEDWMNCERELGFSVPDDYRELVNRYGSVFFDEFITFFNPAAPLQYSLQRFGQGITQGARELRDELGAEEVPYRLFPELGGLFAFGHTANGDQLFWLTRGKPSNWTVVVNGSRSSDWEEFHMTTTEFLTGVLAGRIQPRSFPADFLKRPHTASPAVYPSHPVAP